MVYAESSTWTFTNPANFTFSDTNNSEIAAGVVRLTLKDQTDDDNDASEGFGAGTFSDTQWDTSNSWLELNAIGQTNGSGDFISRIMDAGGDVSWDTISWTPQRPLCKELPDSGTSESAYNEGNASMSGNVLLMHLNESSGATGFSDTSGNSNNSSCSAPTCPTAGVNGKLNEALSFDGTDDLITQAYGSDFDFGTGSFSASGWFKTNGTSNTTTVSVRVNDTDDDAEECVGGTGCTVGDVNKWSSDLELVYDGTEQQEAGMRFNSVAIPQGATISSAYIQFTGDSSPGAGSPSFTIEGEDTDNASAFVDGLNSNISSRTNTSASVAWNNPSAWTAGTADAASKTPDIKTIIQEIVDRSGWSSGNSLAIMVTGTGDSSNYRRSEAYDGISASAPELQVTYKHNQYILSRYDNDQGFKVWMEGSGKVSFGLDDDSVFDPDKKLTSSSSYDDNTWHHFVAVRESSTTARLYIDGSEVASNTTLDAVAGSVSIRITTSSDDAEECVGGSGCTVGAVDLTSSDLELVYDSNEQQEAGMRFPNVTIPQGATISSATIQFTGDSSPGAGSPSLTIKGEDADNAATFSGSSNNISNRTNTSASVAWSPSGWSSGDADAAAKTPDIKTIVQEVVNRGGWASGNALAIMIAGTGSSSNYRRAESQNGANGGADAPLLTVDYTAPLATLTSNSAPLSLGSDEPTNGEYYVGSLDEIAVFSDNLSATEVSDLYKRGALCLKYQVRSCNDASCSGESFIGPDGSGSTYYSELSNSSTSLPALALTNLSSNQYFQYKAYLETDSSSYSPELKSVTIAPTHYDAGNPTIVNVASTAPTYTTLNTFTETLGTSNAGSVRYQISNDGTNWYYHNGSNWVAASGYGQTNTTAEINAAIASFNDDVGSGNFYFKAFLNSDGTQAVELDQVDLDYTLIIIIDDGDGDGDDDDSDDSGDGSGDSGDSSEAAAPTANAGSDLTIVSGQSARLNGAGSTGSGLQYLWQILSGTGSLSSENTSTPTFHSSSGSSQDVVIRLTVTNSEGESTSDTLTIHIIGSEGQKSLEMEETLVAWKDGLTLYEENVLDNDDNERIALIAGGATILLPAGTEDYALALTSDDRLVIGIPGENIGLGQVFLFEDSLDKFSGSIPLNAGDILALNLETDSDEPILIETNEVKRTQVITGSGGDLFGKYLAVGDINGDGTDEILIGAPGAGTDGVTYIYDKNATLIGILFGSSSFPVSSVMMGDYFAEDADGIFFGPDNPALNRNLRWQEPLAETEQIDLAFILEGGQDFEKTLLLDVTTVDTTVSPSASLPGTGEAELYQAMAAGADVNGDGANDIALTTNSGRIFLYFGPIVSATDLDEEIADVMIAGGSPSDDFGHIVVLGDVTGDGIADLIIGAPEYGDDLRGAVYIVFGGTIWEGQLDLTSAPNTLLVTGEDEDQRMGGDLLLADIDEDDVLEIYTVDASGIVYQINLTADVNDVIPEGNSPVGDLRGGGRCSLIQSESHKYHAYEFTYFLIMIILLLGGWRSYSVVTRIRLRKLREPGKRPSL